ncbi:MAG: MMPL family transporter [bacterium]
MQPVNTIGRIIIKYKSAVIITAAGLTIFFAFFAAQLKVAGSSEGWIDKSDPDIAALFESVAKFGSFEIIIIGIESNDTIFKPEVLTQLQRITRRVEKVPHVNKVVSLTNVQTLIGDSSGVKHTQLIPKIPKTQRDLAKLEKEVFDNPLLINNLVSEDGKSAAVIAYTITRTYTETFIQQLDRDFHEIVREETTPATRLYLAGSAILDAEINRLSKRQNLIFPPLVFALVALIMIFIFKRASIILIPMTTIISSIIWTLGIFHLCGRTLGVMTTVLTPLILVLGVALSVHILNKYTEETKKHPTPEEAAFNTFSGIARPCLFTTLTTVAGFSGLMISKTPIVRELGLFASIGILITLVVTMSLMIALLCFIKIPGKVVKPKTQGIKIQSLLDWISISNYRYRWHFLILCGAMFAASFFGIYNIRVETNELDMLGADNKVKQDFTFIENKLTGISSIEFIITGRENATHPKTQQALRRFQTFLEGIDGVKKTISITDYLMVMHRAFRGGKREFLTIPEGYDEINNYLNIASIYGGGEIRPYLTDDRKYARLSARMSLLNTRELEKRLKKVREYLKRHENEHFQVGVTGLVPLYVKMIDQVVSGQVRSFSFVLISIFAMMAILMRSPGLALIGMVPNVIPIGLTLGLMGWIGIPLDIATSMIGCVAIGIAVDDTIHYLSRHELEYAEKDDHLAAMAATLTTTGRAIVFTSVILFCGFIVLLFSSFVPIYYFGLLTAFTMFTALLGDIFLLPAMLLIIKPKIGKKRLFM